MNPHKTPEVNRNQNQIKCCEDLRSHISVRFGFKCINYLREIDKNVKVYGRSRQQMPNDGNSKHEALG